MIGWWLFSVVLWGVLSMLSGMMDASGNLFGSPATATPMSCDDRIEDGQAFSIILQGDIMSMNQIDLVFTEVDIPWVNTCFVKSVNHIGTANWSMFNEDDTQRLSIIRVLVLLSLSAVTVLTVIVFIFPVVIQAVFTVRSLFRT